MIDYNADWAMKILGSMGILFNPEEEELFNMEWNNIYDPNEDIIEILRYSYCEEMIECSEVSDRYFSKMCMNRTNFFNSKVKELERELEVLLRVDPKMAPYN